MATPVVTPMVTLSTSDNKEFKVPQNVAELGNTLKEMISEIGVDATIPLPNISSSTFTKVVEWATYTITHPQPPVSEADRYRTDNLTDWEKTFMTVDMETLFLLVMAANYLHMQGLLDLGCKTIANHIKGSSPEEVKEKFKIPKTSQFYKEEMAVADTASPTLTVAAAVPVTVGGQ